MNSSAQEQEPFQTVYAALWKKSLDSILDEAPAVDGRHVLLCISPTTIQKLQLDDMKCNEEVLLIREEYVSAFDTLKSWYKCSERGGGVVVTGQPGIGACHSFLADIVGLS